KSSPTTFLYQLSSPSSTITKLTDKMLIGSGPYMIESISSKSATLSINQYYTGKQTPKNSRVTFIYAGDMDIIDSMHRVQPDGAISYRMQDISHFQSPNYKLIKSNPNITEIIVLNNQRYPFNIPLVRKALSTEIY